MRLAATALTAGLMAWAGLAQAQGTAPRAILGEWALLCNAPQRVAFAEGPDGKLRRFYLREGQYRTDEEAITAYSEDANFIRLKFSSGEQIVYKRSPEGIREWERRIPGRDPVTKDGKTQIPVVKTFIDMPIFQRCK